MLSYRRNPGKRKVERESETRRRINAHRILGSRCDRCNRGAGGRRRAAGHQTLHENSLDVDPSAPAPERCTKPIPRVADAARSRAQLETAARTRSGPGIPASFRSPQHPSLLLRDPAASTFQSASVQRVFQCRKHFAKPLTTYPIKYRSTIFTQNNYRTRLFTGGFVLLE
jgi:hypothetical protein